MPLVDFFLAHYNKKFRKSVQGISEDTRRLLLNYDWPGNVRELKNALERAMILEEGNLLKPDDLPFTVASGRSGPVLTDKSAPAPLETPLRRESAACRRFRFRKAAPRWRTSSTRLVELALHQSHGNQIKAAKLLNISRDALRYKMKKFGLSHSEEEESRPPPRTLEQEVARF